MKSICLFFASFCICSFAFSQASYLQRIKDTPSVMSHDAVAAYFLSLDSLQEEVKAKVKIFKAENEAVVKSIDPATISQAYMNYGQTVSAADILAMQSAQQKLIAGQQILNDLQVKFGAQKDSIDALYSKDIDVFNTELSKYMSKCSGEVGSVSQCDAMYAALNQSRTKFLNKYFFGPSALYASFLKEYRVAMPAPAIAAALNAMKSAEITMLGIVLPHIEDLAYLELTNDIIILIKEVFVIEYKLWPGK